MIFIQTIVAIIFAIFIAVSTRDENSTHCNQLCGVGISANRVNYPFGFSSGCPIRLNCSSESGEIQIDEFQVQNVTSNGILINLPAKCNRPIEDIKPLFDRNYALTWQNSLLLQNCTASKLSTGCMIPTSLLEARFEFQGCDSKSDNISCYSEENGAKLLSYSDITEIGCRFLFSSMAVDSEKGSGGVFEFQTVELGWWLEGSCHCSPNSNCTEVSLPDGKLGFRCQCKEGFQGDGFLQGDGCRKDRSNPLSKGIILGVIISGGSLLLLLGGFWLYKVIRKMSKIKLKKKFFKRNGGILLQQQMSSNEGTIEKTKIFTSKELEKATDNFNQNRILGQGGQGTVYKGMLIDGRIVAIKKSKLVDESQLEQFINEVVILSQINHRNVVNLFGCCLETNVPLLVYEFVSNGNLFELIHDQNDEFPFSWKMRLQIATEVAGAVAYLHSASSIPIYHRDIKSTNILLDDKYRAKVSDFGTSRSISIEQTHLTTLVHGTFGYLDPEYFQSSQFTEKSDVYSFGVVLAELLTGQKPISTIRSQEDKSLATYFISSLKENRLFDILDARLMKEGGKEKIKAVANIAKRCLNLNGKKRPTMKEVAMELEAIRSSPMPFNSQQNFEEDEYIVELTGPMDGVSISVSSFSDHIGASSSDVHPLL